ncbi:ABC transporter substrate-binding protein [Myxococcaceae bacterium GXIMD 01537]
MRTLSVLIVAATLSGCSLTAAGGLTECETSAECGENRVCTEGFCLPLPNGCGQSYGSTAPGAIQIGAVLPISVSATVPDAGVDESEVQGLNAILLALEEVNQRGVGGKEFTLNLCDTAFDPARTKTQAQWLVDEKKVVAMLTAGSSQTLAATSVTLPKGVLTMSSSATALDITSVQDSYNGSTFGLLWRTSPTDAIQGAVIASLLQDTARFPNVQKVGILYLDDPYGQGLFNVVTEKLKGKKTTQAAFYTRRGEVSAAVSQINSFDPDVTVLVGFEDDARRIILAAAQQPNLSKASGHRWFFTDSVKDAGLLNDSTVRDQVNGTLGTAPAQGAGAAFDSFRSRFRARYNNVDPSNFSFTSHAYDAMYLFALGASYAQGQGGEVTGVKMAEGLTKVTGGTQKFQLTSSNFTQASAELAAGRSIDVEGASGSLDFNAAGEAPSPIELWQVSGSEFTTVQNITPTP